MIDYASVTDKGGREVNEDAVGIEIVNEQTICFCVADGLGGHGRGDEASAIAVQNTCEIFRAFHDKPDLIETVFEAVQKRLLFEKKERRERFSLKTTLSVLTLRSGRVRQGTIGDTRIYTFWDGRVVQQTHDHSMAQLLCDAGQITPQEIRSHPDRSRLLRCIGEEWDNGKSYEIPFAETTYDDQTAFLLCTDGFWGLVEESEMELALKETATAQEWLDSMTALVRQRGEGTDADNYAAVAVRIK